MPQNIKLTVLDQSPVHPDEPKNAAMMSVELAKACDAMGYARYWVAEHHNSPQFAGPSPEILIAAIASATNNIRVGSGGVMLSHYSPYKVAEVFNMLAALFTDRIDLGIGRAPGGDGLSSVALAWPSQPQNAASYSAQAATLKALLEQSMPADHPWAGLHMCPQHDTPPEMWMLGSSGGSATLAGQVGMHLALARFISPDHCTPEVFDAYSSAWKTAGHAGKPKRMLAIGAFCAETQAEAELLAGTAIYRKMTMGTNQSEPLLPPEAIQDLRKSFSVSQEAYYLELLRGFTVGSADYCKTQMEGFVKDYDLDEIAIVTVTHDYAARLESYRLLL